MKIKKAVRGGGPRETFVPYGTTQMTPPVGRESSVNMQVRSERGFDPGCAGAALDALVTGRVKTYRAKTFERLAVK